MRSWATQLLVDQFDAATLRELAAVKERQDPARLARRQLSPAGVEILAEILIRGDRPTVGFFRRHRVAPGARSKELSEVPAQ